MAPTPRPNSELPGVGAHEIDHTLFPRIRGGTKGDLEAVAFREVELTGEELVITDHGRPVVKIVPYPGAGPDPLGELRHSVIRYDAPTEPIGLEDWEALR